MKRILLGTAIAACMVTMCTSGAFAFTYYEAPNGGNMNFYPLMQHQMEQQETLDFQNNPESYKQRREAKDAATSGTVIRNTSGYNPYYSPNYGSTGLQQVHPVNMFFVKDASGNIRIQGLNSASYPRTLQPEQ